MSSTAASLDVISHSANSTRRIGYRLGRLLRGGDVVLLSGDLGTGKTTLAQGIAAGLGITDRITSPTFTLINEYAGTGSDGVPIILYHIDLYRLGPGGTDTLGLDDYLEAPDGIVLIEWPQRAAETLPGTALIIEIEALSETKRRLTLRPQGPESAKYEGRVATLRQELFGAAAR
jgi:tRNA threonylcarbamoyladenosine biosynthesis protein TsaE